MTAATVLAANAVDIGYPGHLVLHGASLRVRKAARLAILGANGSGKTTLLRCLSGAHQVGRGTIEYAGQQLGYRRDDLRTHRRRVQLVLQDPDDQLFSADVSQDVSFGPMNMGLPVSEVAQRVEEALQLLGITHLGERATHQLSYGERKRVALAGAVAMRPEILLLDEPTAGLDPSGVAGMLGTLERLHHSQTTIVLATHDVDLALRWSEEVAVVVDGGVCQGPGVQLLSDGDLLRRAHLSRPWPLELAMRLGWSARPTSLDEVVAIWHARRG